MEGAGIELLNDFLLYPPSYYQEELTYVETAADGSTVLNKHHPTYFHLLTALYWWCHDYLRGNHMPPMPTG